MQKQRERIISYKRFFETAEGKDILRDLANRADFLNAHTGTTNRDHWKKEGKRELFCYIFNQTKYPLDKLDELLKGQEK